MTILEQAIAKLDEEMEAAKDNGVIVVLANYMIDYVTAHPEAAEAVLAEGKTLAGAFEAMRQEAQKHQKGRCAVLSDAEGFAIVRDYYGIDGDIPAVQMPKAPIPQPAVAVAPGGIDLDLDDLLG